MGLEAAILPAVAGLGIGSAVSQGMAGNKQAKVVKQQADYNAGIYEQQAEMVLEQKKLQEYQNNRTRARARGATIAHTAGAGFQFSGSPLAIAIDNETQMELDSAVQDYNLDVQRNRYLSEANMTRWTGKQQASAATAQGYSNAFTTLLNTGLGTYAAGKL